MVRALLADRFGLAAHMETREMPITSTVEWTPRGLVPLTLHLDDRALDIGPRADPGFVSAA